MARQKYVIIRQARYFMGCQLPEGHELYLDDRGAIAKAALTAGHIEAVSESEDSLPTASAADASTESAAADPAEVADASAGRPVVGKRKPKVGVKLSKKAP